MRSREEDRSTPGYVSEAQGVCTNRRAAEIYITHAPASISITYVYVLPTGPAPQDEREAPTHTAILDPPSHLRAHDDVQPRSLLYILPGDRTARAFDLV